jgi:Spy/CpxP family protein refolding chaperone
MKMKPLIALLIVLSSLSFYGQESKKEKIKALKIAYVTKDLNLSGTEAEKFWPIYNAFDDKQFDLRMVKMRKIRRELKSQPLDAISESQANALLNQIEQLDDEIYQNRRKLTIDLKKVISPKKILKLKQVEDDFNKTLLKEYRNRN